jgi:hypothetical protein
MKITTIELEDYNGNTKQKIKINRQLNAEEIEIEGYSYADTEELNIIRFQEVCKKINSKQGIEQIRKTIDEYDRDTEMETYKVLDTIKDILNEVEE